MVISMEEYATLRREFLKVAKFHINTASLNELINFYKAAIDSVRASDNIKDIEGLIRILEKRSVIRYNNITPLRQIAKSYLSHSTIIDKLNDYDTWVKSYTPPYSPQTNLYQLKNGEFNRGETSAKNVFTNAASSSHLNSNNQDNHFCHRYKFPCESPLDIIIDDDLTNPLTNNLNCNNSCNDKRIKDCKIHIVSHKLYNFPRKEENLVSTVSISTDLTIKNERVSNQAARLRHLTTEDSGGSDEPLPYTSLLATPQSIEPQTRISSLTRSNSVDNVKTLRSRFSKLIQRRYVKNLSIFLSFAIILVTLLIVYGFLKNSVHYNPEPSAPPFQEVPGAYPGTSGSNLCAGYISPLNQNRYGVYNVARPTTGPLQTLSENEARFQNYVFEQLSKRMGIFWLDVARQLDIRECEINNIDKQYPDLQDKAYAALKLFANETNLNYWQSTLKKALEKARRKDLAETVEKISNYKNVPPF